MNRLVLWVLIALASLLAGAKVQAAVHTVTSLELSLPGQPAGEKVALPHFIQQEQSRLLTVQWRIQLPAELAEAELPALLIPQTVQGARFSLRGQLIYEVASSDAQTLRNWYRPTLVPLPKAMLTPDGDNTLEVEQTGHLRGWFIAPMLLGEIKTLQPLFETYNFISQTLTSTVNVLSGFVGLFLIFLGWKSDRKLYVYGGLIASLWSLLVGIALISEIPTAVWHLWRLSLYFFTGWLIYCEIAFNFAIYQTPIKRRYSVALLVLINAGWLIFALLGKSAEFYLDTVWTGLVVCIYALTLIWIIGIAVRRRDWRRIGPIFVFLLLAMALSWHDYMLQTGVLSIHLPSDTQELWTHIALQPIYVAHLALPGFIAMTLWLVGNEHVKITREQLLQELRLSQERERIVSDIHDGVGSRINLLLWNMRTAPPEPTQISDELQSCMDELRFAINPPQSGHATLHDALKSLVERISTSTASGISIEYERISQSSTEIYSEFGLHIYKATQECLSNAIRHSKAKQIKVMLDHRDTELEVRISDNGQGIANWDNEQQQQLKRRPTSMGLLSIQNRMRHKNGRCHISSSDTGTQVRLIVQLAS